MNFQEISDYVKSSFGVDQIPILIVHLIALGFLFLCFFLLLYKPTKIFFSLRQKALKKINDDAQVFLKDAEKKSQDASSQLISAKITRLKWIDDGKNEADIQKKQILILARQEQKKIINEANEKADKLKKDVKKDIQEAILKNALSLTEKILKKEVNSQLHQDLLDDFINNLDE